VDLINPLYIINLVAESIKVICNKDLKLLHDVGMGVYD